MLRYFLLFGTIVAVACAVEPRTSYAATRDAMHQRAVDSYSESIRELPGVSNADAIQYEGRMDGHSAPVTNGSKHPSASPSGSRSTEKNIFIASGWGSGLFDAPARQAAGESSGPVARGAGPVAGPVKQRGPTAGTGPQAPEDLSPPNEAPKRLPFQGSGSVATDPEKSGKTRESEGVDGARKHLVEPPKEKAKKQRASRKKPATRQPRFDEDAVSGKPDASVSARRRSQTRQPSFDSTAMPAPPVGSTSRGGLPPLPPALPYNPSSMRTSSTPPPPSSAYGSTVDPRSDGTVMAHVPSSQPIPQAGSHAQPPITTTAPGQFSPRPLRPSNPISGFIMDSFGEPSKPVPVQAPGVQVQTRTGSQSPPQQASPAGEPGVLGQLSSDVQQLGAGIKGVFERLVPSR